MPVKKSKQFKPNEAAERQFARALKQVGRHSGHIVQMLIDGHTIKNEAEMVRILNDYSRALGPWAERQAAKMIARVAQKNKTAWTKRSREIGRNIRNNVHGAEKEAGEKASKLML